MNADFKRVNFLFEQYQRKLASLEEIEELLLLLDSESVDNIDLLRQQWEQSQNVESFFSSSTSHELLNTIFLKDKSVLAEKPVDTPARIFSLKKFMVAASLLVVTGLSLFYLLTRQKPERQLADVRQTEKNVQDDVLPGGNKAILKLPNGAVIVLDSAKNGVLSEQANVSVTKTAEGKLLFKVKNTEPASNTTLLNTIETPKGGQYQVILPDNTIAWLNATSSIKFPSAFSGKYRQVIITGEVYFEVAKDASMPFVVQSKNAEIAVIGTHFNVMDYDDEKVAKTTLLEGSVKLSTRNQSRILKPGQQALYGDQLKMTLENLANPIKEIAWKNGVFDFNDSSIEQIMRQVSRWYDVKVSFEGPVPVNDFTGKVSRNVKLSEFLKILSYAGLKFKIEGKNLIVVS